VVLGHTGCGAIKGAVEDVQLGHLQSITRRIQRCIPGIKAKAPLLSKEHICEQVTKENVLQGINDLRKGSAILDTLEKEGKIKIVGGIYDISTGLVDFFETETVA